MSSSETTVPGGFSLKHFLRDQLRNIAPVFTLLALVIFFTAASPAALAWGMSCSKRKT